MAQPSRPLRYQLALGVALVHAVMMTVFVSDLVLRQREQLLTVSLEQTASLAKTLAANSVSWVLAGDQVGLQEVVAAAQHNYRDLRFALVTSPEGRVLAHSDPSRIGKYMVDPVSRSLADDGGEVQDLVASGDLVDCAAPIRVKGRLIGWARASVTRAGVNAALVRVTWNGVAYTLLAIGLGTVFAFAVANRLTRRLDHVVAVSDKVCQGERALRVSVEGRDEIAVLGRAFNAMLGAIERYRDHLESLVDERTVELTRANRELAVARDKADAANRAKSAFLANMSHEIRTPMNAILGFTQIMRRSAALEPRDRENLEIIHRSGRNLLALINDVLEMSKIEAGRVEFVATTVDMRDLFDDLLLMFRAPAQAKRLNWAIDIAADLPRHEVTDESKLRQILINLVGNAVKFTEAGAVVLRARVEDRGGGDGLLVVEVEDTGPGIPPDERDRLFEAFRQASSGLEKGGTGLGLTISRRHANLMGGDITVTSEPGVGSVFRLEVPVKRGAVADPPVAAVHRRVIGLRPDQGEARVLIVDDKPDNRLFLRQLLDPLGFVLREATNGAEAMVEWRRWRPGLILMDIVMPVMDGHEATRRIREAPGGDAVKIVALSASAFDEDREAVMATGADDFVRKPVTEDVLLATIARHLGVDYDVVEQVGDDGPVEALVPLGPELVARIPPELLEGLRRAAFRADDIGMGALIDQLPPDLESAARTLRHLVGRFDWEALDAALEAVDAV